MMNQTIFLGLVLVVFSVHSASGQEPGSRKTIKELIGILESADDKFVMELPFKDLSRVEPRTVEEIDLLISCVKSKDRVLGLAASQSLANMRNAELMPKILLMLSDGHPGVVTAAINVASVLKDSRAVPALVKLLAEDELIAAKAGTALAQIGYETAIPLLLDRISSAYSPIPASLSKFGLPALEAVLFKLERTSKQERSKIVGVIELIQDQKAIPRLNSLLMYPDSNIRSAAAQSLSSMGALNIMEALENTDPHVRIRALESCAKVEDPKINKQLISIFVEDPDIQVRVFAAQIISQKNIQEAVPFLKTALRNKNPEIRAAAEKALGKMATERKAEGRLRD